MAAWKSLILVGCLWAPHLSLVGQSTSAGATQSGSWFARVWQSEDGLPENNVTGVLQTRDGYLYIGTHSDFVRFDGAQFQSVGLPLPKGRNRPVIRSLLLAAENQLWLAIDGGVIRLTSDGSHLWTTTNGLPRCRPVNVVQDKDGAVWVGYDDGSACRIAKATVTLFTSREGLPGNGQCWLTCDSKGQLWFAEHGRVGVFRGDRFITLLTLAEPAVRIGAARAGGLWICAGRRLFYYTEGAEPVEKGELGVGEVGVEATTVLEGRSGAVWVGTAADGLFLYDGSVVSTVEVSHGNILCLAEDRENSLWVGTGGGGLNRLRPRVLDLQSRKSGLPFDAIRSACEDGAGRLWAVGENGALVRREGGIWHLIQTNWGWPDLRASCVASESQGGVWVGTYQAGLFRCDGSGFHPVLTRTNGLAGNNIRAVLQDSAGDIWIGLAADTSLQRWHNGQPQQYHQPPASLAIRALIEDAAHRIWAGTVDGYLLRVEGDSLVNETTRTMEPPRPIRCLYATPDGSLWIGYAGDGVGRLREGRFDRIGRRHGLPDANISAILPDTTGNLWFSSDRGIFRVRQRELDAIADGRAERLAPTEFGRNEGWPSLQGTFGVSPNASRCRDGRLLFPMLTGLAVVQPEHARLNRSPLPVRVERMVLDRRPLKAPSPGTLLDLPPGHRQVEIEFTALSFVAPEAIQFRHRLEGWDDNWVEDGTRRRVAFSRLPAGRYRFQVRACNPAGIWGEPTSVEFRVQPFWWQTWWFRVGAAVCLVGILTAGIRAYELNQVKQRMAYLERQHAVERERSRIARDIHDDLGAGLTQMGLLADLGSGQAADLQQAQDLFSQIAQRARASVSALEEIVWAANPRNDTLPRLADFLCSLADDCFEGAVIRCRKNVPTGLPSLPVSAELRHNLVLAVKEALVNALKHSRARTVWLRLTWHPPELEIEVEDDGAGFDPGAVRKGGNGLRHQLERMTEIGGTIQTRSAAGQGTLVRFRVPLEGPVAKEGDSSNPGPST